ncbi:hypothetical protein EYR41_002056 [Orbilia oligospora]|uniref:HNH nuclease domain-containing protein n=1 Tax=Orbilia oligospora TaxID=2813651 RepID=A0A8H2HXN5_ORBOL|nr:hypothetical protein EYR41_002056 [Orbilia oligospora]
MGPVNTQVFATSSASVPLVLALRGITAIIGGFELDLDQKSYQKLAQHHELPYPPLDLGEFEVINLSLQEIPTIHLTYSLLTYAYDPDAITNHLWDLLRRNESTLQILDELISSTTSPLYNPHGPLGLDIILTPSQNHTWEHITYILSGCNAFRSSLHSFSKSYLDNLIIPFMTPQPPPPFSPETSSNIQSAFKSLLLARDGHRTIIGGVWNYDRPDDILTNDIEHQEDVHEDYIVPTHLIPYFFASTSRSSIGGTSTVPGTISVGTTGWIWGNQYSANAKLKYYMQKFCGVDVAEDVMMEDVDVVNNPSNGIILTPQLYHSFRNLKWCIEAEPWDSTPSPGFPRNDVSINIDGGQDEDRCRYVYRIRLFTKAQIPGSIHHEDGDVLHFGSCDVFAQIPVPKPRLCNVHASIAKVLRASGAGGAMEAILRNEQSLKEDASTGANWGDLGRDYLMRRLSAISDEGWTD